jgi:AraC-like DNA-binding protein
LDQLIKLRNFDTLEVLQCDDSRHEYPLHYHDSFCISLLRTGMLAENSVNVLTGSILISHPMEVHRNTLVQDTPYSMSTFYVGPDVVSSISNTKYISFPKVIYSPGIFASLLELSTSLFKNPDFRSFEEKFISAITTLIVNYARPAPFEAFPSVPLLEDVKAYIISRLFEPVKLDTLAKQANMSRFSFLRWFRRNTGLTPYNFILMKRIEQSKIMMTRGKPIIHTALDAGFFDQSHFSNCFRKFTGITPRAYQKACNIFLDSTG